MATAACRADYRRQGDFARRLVIGQAGPVAASGAGLTYE